MFTLDQLLTIPWSNKLGFTDCHWYWHTMTAAAAFWWAGECAWVGKYYICMLDVNTWAFYSCYKLTIFAQSFQILKPSKMKIQGQRFKMSGRAHAAVLEARSMLHSQHQLEESWCWKSFFPLLDLYSTYFVTGHHVKVTDVVRIWYLLNKRTGQLKIEYFKCHIKNSGRHHE